jgi:hypothetical protein
MEKPKIHIKKKNRGTFTKYCERNGYNGVTNECINKALNSNSSKLKKKALFARNARSWNK